MKDWEHLKAEIVACERCPRLVAYRREIARRKKRQFQDWDYWGRPVPGLGDPRAGVVLVGLAPAAHGANRTGRLFTGDGSAQTLMQALHAVGLASQPSSLHREDGLRLYGVYITAICRCAPPENKPTPHERGNCLPYLVRELELLEEAKVIVSLGQMAFQGTLAALQAWAQQRGAPWALPRPRPSFAHGAHYQLPNPRGGVIFLLASYHPSRQNTQTGRLTGAMLIEVLREAKRIASLGD